MSNRWPRGAWLLALLLGLRVTASHSQPMPAVPPVGTPAGWKETLLPRQQVPATRFALIDLDGARVLRMAADASYGTLVHALAPEAGTAAAAHTLSWRWRVDRTAEGADLRQRNADDAAAKICAMFDLPMERVPFLERQTLRLARTVSGQPLPAATLCYVWDGTLPAGTVLANVYTRRMRWIVLHGPGAGLARWHTERRDLRADFLRAFGDEASEVPPLTHLVVGADADNTQGRSLAYVADLELRP